MAYQAFTQNGYGLDEIISALQKDIRRGHEEAALYWALELLPRYEAYLWRRLLVICNEDIGIAQPEVLTTVHILRSQYFEFRGEGKDGTCRLILANAILLMCRSPKARTADHFQRVVTQSWMEAKAAGAKRPIPDYALDKHTLRGKQAGRGFAHWVDEGCQLSNPGAVDDPYAERAQALWREGKNDAPVWGKREKRGGEPEQLDLFGSGEAD
jgi:replication-associated recombination protein RarA